MDEAPNPETRICPADLVDRALQLQREGGLEAAADCYRQALALDPGHFPALCLYGEMRALAGEPEAGAELLDRALEVNPGSARAHASLAQALWRLHRPEEALSHLGRALVLKPDSVDALLNRGIVLRELERPEEALASLDRALALEPGRAEALFHRGGALLALGRAEDALACYDRVLALEPERLDVLRNRGAILLALGRPLEAVASYDRALALSPEDAAGLSPEGANALRPEDAIAHGSALLQLQDPASALASFDRALAVQPRSPEALQGRAAALWQLSRKPEALASYQDVLALRPDDPDLRLNHGNLLMELNRPQDALADYDRALAARPEHPDTLLARGNALLELGRPDQALDCYDRALAIRPGHGDALLNRGNVLLGFGRHQDALDCYDRALALRPEFAHALVNRAAALLGLRRPGEALASADRALALEPGHVDALINRGTALIELKRPNDALASFDRALALQPDNLDAWMNRGTALHGMGRNLEALDSYDRALAIRPDHAGTHSNKIFVRDFLPELSFREHQDERRRFWEIQARTLPPETRPHRNDRDPSRPLVLGYVSADFKHHSAAACFGPVLRRHDRAAFRIVCYSGVKSEDEWTREFRELADLWRPIAGMTDTQVAEQIRADQVDILIDLSGHSKGNRLLVFARKPAPVQVTAWGHGGGTGVPAVDYQFTDPVFVPDRARPLFAETCWDLPCCITFEAPQAAPEVGPLPARANGFVTFGSLNRLSKVSPAALALWCRILAAVPGSRLLVKDFVLDDPAVRERFLADAAGHGIGPERIELRGASSHRDHMAAYNDVDIVLDTFPSNGGVTTWEALWMGAPVVSILGGSPGSRVSGAILHALGLGGWVAEREADYLERAVGQAADLDALARFRDGIRAGIMASAAGDPARYTRAVEAAYRAMWHRWLAAGAP
jgi:predicted O-linked N-acetylglucosamine transferase (SPINDLY family)